MDTCGSRYDEKNRTSAQEKPQITGKAAKPRMIPTISLSSGEGGVDISPA